MGIFDLDQVKLTITKRAAATTTAECTSPYTYEKVFCKNGWAAIGCFTADPCTDDGGATSIVTNPPCTGEYSYYHKTCSDGQLWTGCLNFDPCLAEYFPSAAATTTSTEITSSSLTKTAFSASATPSTQSASLASSKPSVASNTLLSSLTLSATSSQLSSGTSFSPITATSPVSTGIPRSSASSRSKTVAVVAGTIGALVGAMISLSLILLLLKWRKGRTESSRTRQNNSDSRLQGTEVDGPRTAFQDKQDIPASAYTDADHDSRSLPPTKGADTDKHATYKRSDLYSAASSMSPVPPGPETPGSTPDQIGGHSELEVPAFHIPAELSPNPERSSINTPRRRLTVDGPLMHSNLDSAGEEYGGHGANKAGNSHVLSWMHYDGEGSDPVG